MNTIASWNSSLTKWFKKVAFYLDDIETGIGLGINLFLLGLIFTSLGVFVASTYPVGDGFQELFQVIDMVILVIFTIEYLFRFLVAEQKKKFFWSIFSLIDLVAIFPLLFGLVNISFIRIFRWFRILRIIRFWELEKKYLGVTVGENIVFLRVFLTLFSIIFIYAGLIYQMEHNVNRDGLKNFFDAFYFVVVTMTTVGYGDVTPLSQPGRVMTLLMILTGVLFIPWQLSEFVGQIVKKVALVENKCEQCNLSRHDPDAQFCKQCGNKLR